MGTRHLTTVKVDGQTKIAQYGQWDGYPTGAGENIKNFLKGADLDVFVDKVRALTVWDDEYVSDIWKNVGGSKDGWVGMDGSALVESMYPELSRNTGSDILSLVLFNKVSKVQLESDFANDKVWCEWHYIIDLDEDSIAVESFGQPVDTYTIDQFRNLDMAELEGIDED